MLSLFIHVWLFETLWTVAFQASLSMGFSRQEYWSGLPSPPTGDLPHPGIKPMSLTSPALTSGFFTTSATWEIQWPHKSSTEMLSWRFPVCEEQVLKECGVHIEVVAIACCFCGFRMLKVWSWSIKWLYNQNCLVQSIFIPTKPWCTALTHSTMDMVPLGMKPSRPGGHK